MDEHTPLKHNAKGSGFRIANYDLRMDRRAGRGDVQPEPKKETPRRLRRAVVHVVSSSGSGQSVVPLATRECALVQQLRVAHDMELLINARIGEAINALQVTATVLAFVLCDGSFADVQEPLAFERDALVTQQNQCAISWDQLSLDLQPHGEQHKRVASALICLRGMTSPMHCIISKQRMRVECKPSPDAPTLWGRLWGWEQMAYYYKLVVDFSQTEPQHQVRDALL